MIPIGEKKSKSARRGGGGEKDRVQGVETRKIEIEVDLKEVTMVTGELQTQNSRKADTETARKSVTEKVKRW